MHIAIIEARYYEGIADLLYSGVEDFLKDTSLEANYQDKITYDRITIGGAFELPLAMKLLIETGKYDGIIALGCVIRGETTHYDYVCNEASRGLAKLSVDYTMPLGFGVLTVENKQQAIERADPNKKNKGAEIAKACVDMIKLKSMCYSHSK